VRVCANSRLNLPTHYMTPADCEDDDGMHPTRSAPTHASMARPKAGAESGLNLASWAACCVERLTQRRLTQPSCACVDQKVQADSSRAARCAESRLISACANDERPGLLKRMFSPARYTFRSIMRTITTAFFPGFRKE
jgi:hypothetical protein